MAFLATAGGYWRDNGKGVKIPGDSLRQRADANRVSILEASTGSRTVSLQPAWVVPGEADLPPLRHR